MSILGLLMPAALLMGFVGLLAFIWAMKSGQFDDPAGDARRILLDDDLDEMGNAPKPQDTAQKTAND